MPKKKRLGRPRTGATKSLTIHITPKQYAYIANRARALKCSKAAALRTLIAARIDLTAKFGGPL